jgi:hypothetical protein
MSNQEYEDTLVRIDELTNQLIAIMSSSVQHNNWNIACTSNTYDYPWELKNELDALIEKRDLFEKDNQVEVIL